MVDYIIQLPSELQSKILDEIPQFTRLSKNTVAGKFYLESLHSKSITFRELDGYMKLCKPDRLFRYYKDKNEFTVLESYFQFGFYQTTYHNFYYENDNIIVNVTNKSANNHPIHLLKYDIYTIYNIYKLLRKEYINLDKVLSNYFNESKNYFKVNNDFIDKIIQANYVYSNRLNIDDPRRLSILTVRLSHMIKNKDNNEFKNRIIDEMDNIYDNNLKEIQSYVNNLK